MPSGAYDLKAHSPMSAKPRSLRNYIDTIVLCREENSRSPPISITPRRSSTTVPLRPEVGRKHVDYSRSHASRRQADAPILLPRRPRVGKTSARAIDRPRHQSQFLRMCWAACATKPDPGHRPHVQSAHPGKILRT